MSKANTKNITVKSTVSEITSYISNLQLGNYTFADIAKNFSNEVINGHIFLNLEKAELNTLGIIQFSRRNALYDHIQELKKHSPISISHSTLNSKFNSNRNTVENTENANMMNNMINLPPLTDISDWNKYPVQQQFYSPKNPINMNYQPPNAHFVPSSFINHHHPQSHQPQLPPQYNNDTPISMSELAEYFDIPLHSNSFSNILSPSSPMYQTTLYSPAYNPSANQTRNAFQFPVSTVPVSSAMPLPLTSLQQSLFSPAYIQQSSSLMSIPPTPLPIPPTLPSSAKIPIFANNMSYLQAIKNQNTVGANVGNIFINNSQNPTYNNTTIGGRSACNSSGTNTADVNLLLISNSMNSKVEECYFHVAQNKHLVKFIGVYRGINSNRDIFLLMSKEHIQEFNDIIELWNIKPKKGSQDKSSSTPQKIFNFNESNDKCNIEQCQQIFCSNLDIRKCRNGWQLIINKEDFHLPFNPLAVFTYDMNKKLMVDIKGMSVRGRIHNIDTRGLMWITTQMKVDAIEDNYVQNKNKSGPITSLILSDNRQQMFKDRNTSYMMHDWNQVQFECKKGDVVECCLKLSTKANNKKKHLRKNKRPVYVQTWNVRQLT